MKKILITLLSLCMFGFGYAAHYITDNAADKKTPQKVSGIGGIFFKCKNPKVLKEWYGKHLGINTDKYGTSFEWRLSDDSTKKGYTQWSPFKETTTYFAPSVKDFMINYRVDDMEFLVKELRNGGVTILDTVATYDYGKFIHILDPEGNKIELWEPNDIVYGKNLIGVTK